MLGENYCMYFLLLYYSNIWLSKHFIFTNTIHMNNIRFEGLGILFTFGFNNIHSSIYSREELSCVFLQS